MTIEPGTKVRYHGSLTYHHGEMVVANTHLPFVELHPQDKVRYVLQYGQGLARGHLTNVRPESFTVLPLQKSETGFEGNEEETRCWSYDWDETDHLNEAKSNGHIIYVEGYFFPNTSGVIEFFTAKLTFSDKLP